ncbi:MAG: 16S rRNA (guanine(966)-N(2))-methyltransferase RsmD [Gemmatimonadetes bacterium]|nr:16S rRNA (guanine(966)-N(2))-methyltransferase RsmD [Gemmatimonadota bacterium]
MRIVAGRWRGRRLKAPAGEAVRPTGDRVREAWMSIVQLHIPGAVAADLFAGTGALGIEALSRGAASVEFVDLAPASLALLKENLALLGASPVEAIVRRADALRVAAERADDPWDLAFADPPYRQGLATELAERWLEAPFAAILGIEHDVQEPLPGAHDTRRYGITALSFYYRDRATPRGGAGSTT